MDCESSDVVRFDISPLLQGQMRTAKLKGAYYSLIIDPRGLQCKPSYRKSCAGNLLMCSHLTLGPPLQGQTRILKLKSAYNSLIIGFRGFQCEINV